MCAWSSVPAYTHVYVCGSVWQCIPPFRRDEMLKSSLTRYTVLGTYGTWVLLRILTSFLERYYVRQTSAYCLLL